MLKDSHIHVGQYKETYEFPKNLVRNLSIIGVTHFAVSSTTICEENYEKVISEMRELIILASSRVYPVLWITPRSLHNNGVIKLLDSGIKWKCVKIHPMLSPDEWREDCSNRNIAIEIARNLKVPMLIHTGEAEGCYPSYYDNTIKKNPDINFILAHGRPINEAIELMKKHKNAFVDTAFMPIENIDLICQEHLADRVLWGTDYPITKYFYKNADMKSYYQNLISQLKKTVELSDFELITHINFERLFDL